MGFQPSLSPRLQPKPLTYHILKGVGPSGVGPGELEGAFASTGGDWGVLRSLCAKPSTQAQPTPLDRDLKTMVICRSVLSRHLKSHLILGKGEAGGGEGLGVQGLGHGIS